MHANSLTVDSTEVIWQSSPMIRGPLIYLFGRMLLVGMLTIAWVGVSLPGEDDHDGSTPHFEQHHGPHQSFIARADCRCDLQSSPYVLPSTDSGESFEFLPSMILDLLNKDEHIPGLHTSARASPRAPPFRVHIVI